MPRTNPPVPVDGHVHFHTLAAVGPTLDAAARNFRAASGCAQGLLGVLLLTQAGAERVFEQLRGTTSADGWSFTPARDEPETLMARRGDTSIAVVCGRQVRAADGLEVLALGTLATFPDGLAFRDAIDAVRTSGALAVIPWGFGKWLGERGERVAEALRDLGPEALLVGDNGSRLALAGLPPLVRTAAANGFRVLPGTDPFPFAGGHRRAGQFGFLAECELPESAPWHALRAWLVDRTESPVAYGDATGAPSFVFNQVGIQVFNRLFRSRTA